MRSTIMNTLALSTSVSASVLKYHSLPRNSGACSFTLTAQGPGSANGTIGQIYDGQNRIGGGHPTAVYSYHNGRVVDSSKRGCILTPPTRQWQCDQGVPPHTGFSLGCDGTFLHNGSLAFYACPVNDHGEWNVYTRPVTGQKKCVAIKLTASGCDAPCPAIPKPNNHTYGLPDTPVVDHKWPCEEGKGCHKKPSPPRPTASCNSKSPCHTANRPPPAPSTTGHKNQTACSHQDEGKCYPPAPPPSSSPTPCHADKKCTATQTPTPIPCGDKNHGKANDKYHPKSCPVDLNGAYEFPHLIVPVHRQHPDFPFGNKFSSTINELICTTYNFDMHPDYNGSTCSLVFLLPKHEDLTTSSYKFKGKGSLQFNKLVKPVTTKTTFNNKGAWEHLSTKPIEEDSSMLAWSGVCEGSKRIGYEVCGEGIELVYFQDYNPSPIGLFMRVC